MLKDAFRTGNPALSSKSFGGFAATGAASATGTRAESHVMTISGTVNRTAILLAIMMVAALLPWRLFFNSGNPGSVFPLLWLGLIGGLITALITIFKRTWAPVLAPIYAGCEGLVLGAVSAMYELRFPGIAFQAVALTIGTLAVLLVVYKSGAIKATAGFKAGVVAATGAVCLVYLGTFIMRAFGLEVGFMHDAGPLGIGISLVIVTIAALNLVLDFDFIEQGAARGAPRYMEWYAAFGLLVTLVWLYLEILRLLSKLNKR
jgi:uncharacterized YccA/Bax inhibitor family protein